MNRRAIAMGVAMMLAVGLSYAITPRDKLAEHGPRVNLEAMVPERFGNWVLDETLVPIEPPPDLKKILEETYDQTLSKTFIDKEGNRIMLSIAYGGQHGEGMQTHKPEICYPAQGFRVEREASPFNLQTRYGNVDATRMVAAMGARIEPITYWVVVGGQQTHFGMQMKLAQLKHNLTGVIPDGMLVRVSSIDQDETRAYRLQEDFIQAMLAGMAEPARHRLLGQPDA